MGFKFSLIFLAGMLILLQFLPFSDGQLSSSETRIMFQVQNLLEYPQAFQGWSNWTNFCFLPPSPSLMIVCSNHHITELTVTGNRTSPSQIPKPKSGIFPISSQTLSSKFSIDAFFTVLTKLPSLKKLSLVSLGLWGPLPEKIDRFKSLQVLNLSSNFISGEIPSSISTMGNLKSLILGDNLFNGSFPDLRKLQFLEEIDLGNNHLGPEFPKLGKNLVSIKLGNNSMRSGIHLELMGFDELRFLDVSFNKLVGPIPSSLFSLPSIEYLNLGKNQFSGVLSANISCNEKLKFVDISNNLLMGKLPSCFRSPNGSNRKVVDLWNCLSNASSKYQHAYSFCHKEALAVKPPIGDQAGDSSGKIGLILGIIGGTVATAGAFVLLILVIIRRSDKKKDSNYKCDSFVFENRSVPGSKSPAIDGRRVKSTMRMVSLGIPPYHVFTLEEMEDATNNFDPSYLVGEGTQGQIYKGRIRDGTVVLVKCLKLKQKHSPQILQHHMEVISQLRHRHLVSVIGHCIVTYQDHPNAGGSTLFIVLEYVANGSLREHLTDWRKREFLKWPQRMGITMGIARGIQFLHSGISPGIFGNDLKIEDILLDDSLSAKISSYNMTLPSKVGVESPLNGQAASIRFDSTENAKKDDIYQLGVILLQVITGKPSTSEGEMDQLRFELERRLAEAPSTLREMTDPVSRGTFAYDSLKTMAQITVNCLCAESSRRPSIEDVMWNMQYAMQVQEGWNSTSGNLSTKISGQLNNIS